MGEDEPPLEWPTLGTFGPHTTAQSPGRRRDLGAGGSLVDDAERARALRQAGQPRWTAPSVLYTVGGVVLVLGFVLALALSGFASMLGVLTMVAGVVTVLAGARLHLSRTDAEERLRQQARTERRVAAELDTLTASGWTVLHDRLLPGTHHRVAHIAIGPAGVVVVTPIPAGPLHIVGHVVEGDDYRQLYAGALHLDTWLNARWWEIEQVEPAIAHTLQDTVWRGPTVPLAVRVSPVRWLEWLWPRRSTAVPDMPYEWRGVELRPLTVVTEMVAGLPSPLAQSEVATVATAVERICPPAGRADPHSTDPSAT